jgi:hypothetical protein
MRQRKVLAEGLWRRSQHPVAESRTVLAPRARAVWTSVRKAGGHGVEVCLLDRSAVEKAEPEYRAHRSGLIQVGQQLVFLQARIWRAKDRDAIGL